MAVRTNDNRKLSRTFKMAVAGIVIAAAAGSMPAYAGEVTVDQPSGHDAQHMPWGYGAGNGPEHWAEKFPLCGAGQQQSPINLADAVQADLLPLDVRYGAVPLSLVNNGHTVQVNVPPGNSGFSVGGKSFELVQFHFHTPSEYALDGQRYAGELHFVHKDAHGNLAVIGVLITQGRENDAAKAIWDRLPARVGQKNVFPDVMIQPGLFLPDDPAYFKLSGSLTTPPCSEGVAWFVMARPIEFSAAQIAKFKQIIPDNARPLQKRNNRPVFRGV